MDRKPKENGHALPSHLTHWRRLALAGVLVACVPLASANDVLLVGAVVSPDSKRAGKPVRNLMPWPS
ncbi:MAG: hypothetical protein LBE53_07210 [Paucimonas sp.]|jgi:hypothetical protein|nr:hypothetical protein [Paucimonas sp.]